MADIAVSTAARIEVIESIDQVEAVAGVDLVAGTFAYLNSSNEWVQALASTTTGAASGPRLILRTVKAGEALTCLKQGKVSGFTLTSQAPNTTLYLGNTGTLSDSAGTVSTIVGRVIAGNANQVTAAHDKIVEIDCPV